MTGALVCWFTGLSGAGKSTVAEGLMARLRAEGLRVLALDGDAVRTRLHRHLGFTESDIKENNRLIAELCVENGDAYDVILVPIISPYAISRRDARARIGGGFCEVYCKADLSVVSARDVKGLYGKAARGEIGNLIGYSPETVYEPPPAPDVVLDTTEQSPEQAIDGLYRFVRSKMAGQSPGRRREAPP